MDPHSKFVTPQPAAPSHAELSIRRTGTAAPVLSTDFAFTKDRSLSASSPTRSPWRRFFDRALISRSSENRRCSANNDDHRSLTSPSSSSNYDIRPQTSSEGTRTRDISPASLRRLLVEEIDTSVQPVSRGSLTPSANSRTPSFDELDQVDEEDDDYFVGTTNDLSMYAAEEPLFTTRLSPPPLRRGVSPVTATSSSAETVVPSPRSPQPPLQSGEDTPSGLLISPVPQQPLARLSMPESPILSVIDTGFHSACPSSTLSSAMNSPASPTLGEFPSFYDTQDDDDDIDERFPFFSHEETRFSSTAAKGNRHAKVPSTASFSRYCLPQLVFSTDKLPSADNTLSTSPHFTTVSSPLLMPRSGEPVGENGSSNLLGSSLDVGLGDFASELRWVADSITSRR
ncbi:hypothetical protein LEL_05210 [Akanthomyces lecanii RCEF 1005]|uniref:Uncharacterized protein n=1 Tax=Akanthomyces lecanii RCEF 1005 TaxID=1081108 RepID=A0A168HWS2_CORDF|nr:hypothetical protein LEL_05210 [Akanthomyces lecanii RCEF 1005]